MEAGVIGIILGGTLGEASVLTTAEKEQLVKFAIKKSSGKVPEFLNIINDGINTRPSLPDY